MLLINAFCEGNKGLHSFVRQRRATAAGLHSFVRQRRATAAGQTGPRPRLGGSAHSALTYERIGLAIARSHAQQLVARLGCVDVCRAHRNGAHVDDAVLACEAPTLLIASHLGNSVTT
jgi:hypothetical protein